MKGLILAGGHGTRLRPLTFTGNKHMIPIANKPMLYYGLDHLAEAGIKEIGVILGPIKEGVREAVGDGSKFGVKISYIDQPEPKGLAHAVLLSEEFIKEEPFVMYLGDNLIKQGVKPLIYSYLNEGTDCVICVNHVNNPEQFGIVELDSKGKILRLTEKPKVISSNLALAGVYLFNKSVFEAVHNIAPSYRNELEITDAIQYLLERGKKIGVQRIEGWWKDTGKPDDLIEANQLVLDDIESRCLGTIDSSSQILGKVHIGKNTIVRENCKIKGPVIIGENCEIGPNVYIGPYASIGDNVKIQSGEIESSIIMQDTTMNYNTRVIDSIIGRRSTVKSGDNLRPAGSRFILGDHTLCNI